MNRVLSVIMYLLWFLTIVFILAATFTNFKYEDLNALAIVLLVFSVLNSLFVLSRKK